jgi:hypothetical protein
MGYNFGSKIARRVLMQITIDLDENTYALISNEAKVKQRTIEDLVLDCIREKYNPSEMGVVDPMDIEMAAYETMHADLVRQYLGEFVAITDGKLVDHDFYPHLLMRRLRSTYPKTKVIHVTKVRPSIQDTILLSFAPRN